MIEELHERLRQNLDRAKEAMEVAQKNPFIEGSRGQLVEHPGFAVAVKCDDMAVKIVRQLRMAGEETQEARDAFDELAKRRDRRAA